MPWSNFHTWDYFRSIHSKEAAREQAPKFWDSIYPFATCLGMATSVTAALKHVLGQDAELAAYADRVQLATDVGLERCKEMSPPRFHCVTMIRFLDHCVVIDLVAQAIAFKVWVHSMYTCTQACFRYAYVGGRNQTRALYDCPRPDNPLGPWTDMETDTVGSSEHYAYPAAKAVRNTPLVLVDTLTVKMDIIQQQTKVKVPYVDWLTKLNNAWFLHSLRQHEGFERGDGDAIACFTLSLGTGGADFAIRGLSTGTLIWLGILDRVCTALGLPKGEVLRMVDVVVDFWKEAFDSVCAKDKAGAVSRDAGRGGDCGESGAEV
ncbi:hypothetical protein BDW02DRAFT_602526 [Decorospora gaudefroyi]|uniref:Uncharacterized protein n=1 Tax=Decorospora gaudefroyi TaxID=184978 RepID=A0A6A5K450_9PLEO|nr:hypothetical protein BDW02DRAFT_602526 [Decorospora gaudefroyi]